MTIDELIKCVGMPYEHLDNDGKAQGCMLPIYLLYPKLPHFDWPDNLGEFMKQMFKKHLHQIEFKDIEKGDLILIRLLFGLIHPVVYVGDNNIVDCMIETGVQKSRLTMISRIEGVYRCQR